MKRLISEISTTAPFVPLRAGTHWNLACIRWRRQAGGTRGRFSSPNRSRSV